MLADFQQALADLVASPGRCQEIREQPDPMFTGYDLTPRERIRLVAIARHPAMAANCMVYRSNRLTPLALNFPDTCAALGPRLRPVVDQFWAEHPTDNFVHFLIESDRFATFLESIEDALSPDARQALHREATVVRTRLTETVQRIRRPVSVQE
jgi:hypothetical protein